MPLAGRRFVGFGFGAIQSALFVYEARRSGQFAPDGLTVAEVDAALVRAVRAAGGRYTINIAHPDRVERALVEGVELLDPAVPADRARLIDAIAGADELCTALPGVGFYARGGETAVARLLGAGLARRADGQPAIIYTAENHNDAAGILTGELRHTAPPAPLARVQVLDTVIGKMSGVITDPAEVARLKLAPLTPATPGRAVLVESFNRILISRITLPGAACGIPAFVQTDHLPAFAEAKLYGHNAVHALLGCLAQRRGLTVMAQARGHGDLMALARRAFLDECGPALCRKHGALGEALFTPDGFRAYAQDLLQRMVNPNLHDLVARVIRDPRRKLGYDDRIFGAMRLALTQGIAPLCLAQGAAIAVRMLAEDDGLAADSPDAVGRLLGGLWGPTPDGLAPRLIALTWDAMSRTS